MHKIIQINSIFAASFIRFLMSVQNYVKIYTIILKMQSFQLQLSSDEQPQQKNVFVSKHHRLKKKKNKKQKKAQEHYNRKKNIAINSIIEDNDKNNLIVQKRQTKCQKLKTFRRNFSDGSSYKGDKLAKLRHGFGRHSYKDGSTYVGQYHNGVRHGYGEYRDPNTSSRYWGDYNNGYRQGHGKYQIKNILYYQGDWQHGKMNGQGKLIINAGTNKLQYQGHFQDNKWAIEGKFIDKNHKVHKLVMRTKNEINKTIEILRSDWETFSQIKDYLPQNI